MTFLKKNSGISIIEIILVLAVVALMFAIIVPSLISFRKNQAIQNSTNALVSLLEEARAKTLASYNNTFYSVFVDTDRATIFDGSSYSSTDSLNKVVFYESPIILQSISLNGGGSNISFERLKGTTTNYGTIILQIPSGSSKTITVSASGIVTRD